VFTHGWNRSRGSDSNSRSTISFTSRASGKRSPIGLIAPGSVRIFSISLSALAKLSREEPIFFETSAVRKFSARVSSR